jgi:hypothetical protein
MRRVRSWLAGIALVSACEGAPAAPQKPTWVDDVEPILRANCFHCHGSEKRDAMALRWDFYDPKDPALTAVHDFSSDFALGAGKLHGGQIVPYVKMKGDMRMPPPPASPLTEPQVTVLERWTSSPERGTRGAANHRPTAEWLSRPTTVVVSDEDHEQVLGKVTCPGKDEVIIGHTGATRLRDGSQPPCMATLFDGQDLVTVDLK